MPNPQTSALITFMQFLDTLSSTQRNWFQRLGLLSDGRPNDLFRQYMTAVDRDNVDGVDDHKQSFMNSNPTAFNSIVSLNIFQEAVKIISNQNAAQNVVETFSSYFTEYTRGLQMSWSVNEDQCVHALTLRMVHVLKLLVTIGDLVKQGSVLYEDGDNILTVEDNNFYVLVDNIFKSFKELHHKLARRTVQCATAEDLQKINPYVMRLANSDL